MGKIKERGKTYAIHKASDKLNDYYGSAMLNVVQFNGYDIKNTYIDGYQQAEKDLELTWKDIRELYIIFAEVDTEIEFCKCDIQTETIGYYQEVLKRFKAQKGE